MRGLRFGVLLAMLAISVDAQSQVVSTVSLTRFGSGNGGAMFVVNRVVALGNLLVGPYAVSEGYNLIKVTPPVPGTAEIVGIGGDSTYPIVMLSNGDVYVCESDWRYLNNALSNIVSVAPGVQMESSVSMGVSPNPSRGEALLDVFVPEDSEVVLEVVDVTGRRVGPEHSLRLSKGLHGGLDVLARNSGSLAPGSYFVRARINGEVLSARAVVIK